MSVVTMSSAARSGPRINATHLPLTSLFQEKRHTFNLDLFHFHEEIHLGWRKLNCTGRCYVIYRFLFRTEGFILLVAGRAINIQLSSVSPCLCWREWTQSRLCSLPRAGRFCDVGIWRPECLGLTGENSEGLFQLQSSNFPFPSSASFCSFPQVDTPRMSLINLHHTNLDFRICFPGNQDCRGCWQN